MARKSTSSTRLIPRSKFSTAMSLTCSSRATTAETSTLSSNCQQLQSYDRCGYASSMMGVDDKSELSQHDEISDCNQVLLEAELQLQYISAKIDALKPKTELFQQKTDGQSKTFFNQRFKRH